METLTQEEIVILKEMVASFSKKKVDDEKMALIVEREKELSIELQALTAEYQESLDAMALEIELSKNDCEALAYNPDATPAEKEQAQTRYEGAMLARKQAIEALAAESKAIEEAHREKRAKARKG